MTLGSSSNVVFKPSFNLIVRPAEGQPQVVCQTSNWLCVLKESVGHKFPVEGDAGPSYCFDNAVSLILDK